jgi:hypothetical protein
MPEKRKLRKLHQLSKDKLVSVLSLGLVLISLFTLLGLTRKSQNIARRASTGVPHAVNWDTSTVKLTADDFFILANGKKFVGAQTYTRVTSDPGDNWYTTLEVEWEEGGLPMRLYMYFHSDGIKWWVDEVRTYDGNNPGNWIYYTNFSPYFEGTLGEPVTGAVSLISDEGDDSIYFKNLYLLPFKDQVPNVPDYKLQPLPGNDVQMKISDVSSVYQVVAKLLDKNGNLVTNQSRFKYEWSVDDNTIVSVTPILYCFGGILNPCPEDKGQLRSISPGDTTVHVKVTDTATGETIGETSWNVNVTYVIIAGTPNAPTNANFTTTVDSQGNARLFLNWEDNSLDENGFMYTYVIDDNHAGNVIRSTGNLTQGLITILPCGADKQYHVSAQVFALNENGTSLPAFAEEVVHPENCVPEPEKPLLPGDINLDGKVDVLDYVILFENFGRRA